MACGWFDPKNMPERYQLRIMGVALLIVGIIEYGVGVAENYIIAAKSQDDELMYQYSSNILDIFSNIFIFVNTGFLTMLTVRETSANDTGGSKKRKNISKIFHFGCVAGFGSGLAVAILLLSLRRQFFDILGQPSYAQTSASFFHIRVPFIPIEYMTNVISAALLGLMQIKPLILAAIISNGLYIPVLIGMMAGIDDKVAAIAWANAFQIFVNFVTIFAVLCTASFKSQYEIFDFSVYKTKKLTNNSPLLSATDGIEEPLKDPTTISEMGKAAGLLFTKNFFYTVSQIVGMILLASHLSKVEFAANNVVQNTIELSQFAAFYNSVLNIFGPRCIKSGDLERYSRLIKHAIINTCILMVLTVMAYFLLHTGETSIKKLTTSAERPEVEHILNPIWPIWLIGIFFNMTANLYDTLLVNFEKYAILGIWGIFKAVIIVTITLISAFKYDSLTGFILSGLVGNLLETVLLGYLFHFKYYKKLKSMHPGRLPIIEQASTVN